MLQKLELSWVTRNNVKRCFCGGEIHQSAHFMIRFCRQTTEAKKTTIVIAGITRSFSHRKKFCSTFVAHKFHRFFRCNPLAQTFSLVIKRQCHRKLDESLAKKGKEEHKTTNKKKTTWRFKDDSVFGLQDYKCLMSFTTLDFI